LSVLLKENEKIKIPNNVENLFLISAMFNKFVEKTENAIEFCKENGIKRFISADRFHGLKQTIIAEIK
jgi:hypothetical protein